MYTVGIASKGKFLFLLFLSIVRILFVITENFWDTGLLGFSLMVASRF